MTSYSCEGLYDKNGLIHGSLKLYLKYHYTWLDPWRIKKPWVGIKYFLKRVKENKGHKLRDKINKPKKLGSYARA